MILPELHAFLHANLADRDALIIGSAPDLVLPENAGTMPLLCVNGSVISANAVGLSPLLTVFVGYTTAAEKRTSADTMARLAGLSSHAVAFIEKGDSVKSAKNSLATAGFSYDLFYQLDHNQRLKVIHHTTGLDFNGATRDDRPSNGVFAAVIALWAGARTVTLAGISLRGGHRYLDYFTERFHQVGDARCLEHFATRMPERVLSTHPELQHSFGLRSGSSWRTGR